MRAWQACHPPCGQSKPMWPWMNEEMSNWFPTRDAVGKWNSNRVVVCWQEGLVVTLSTEDGGSDSSFYYSESTMWSMHWFCTPTAYSATWEIQLFPACLNHIMVIPRRFASFTVILTVPSLISDQTLIRSRHHLSLSLSPALIIDVDLFSSLPRTVSPGMPDSNSF